MAYDSEHEYTPAERLRLVAEAVSRAKREELDLGAWQCGTTACAIGHAIACFPSQLKMSLERVRRRLVPQIEGKQLWQPKPDGGDELDLEVLGEHFGLTAEEADALFGGDDLEYGGEVTPEHVSEVILTYAELVEQRALAGVR